MLHAFVSCGSHIVCVTGEIGKREGDREKVTEDYVCKPARSQNKNKKMILLSCEVRKRKARRQSLGGVLIRKVAIKSTLTKVKLLILSKSQAGRIELNALKYFDCTTIDLHNF